MFFSYSFVKSLHKSPHLSQMIIAKFLYVSNFFWKNLLLFEKATFLKNRFDELLTGVMNSVKLVIEMLR